MPNASIIRIPSRTEARLTFSCCAICRSAGRRSFPALVKVDNYQYVKQAGVPFGHVRNCTFRRIAVFAEPGVPPPSIMVTSRTPPDGEMRPFENVTLEGFSINGKPADWSAFSFSTNTPIALRP